MRQIVEFRIPEERARRYLKSSQGILLGGSVRKYVVYSDSDEYDELRNIVLNLRSKGERFFTSCVLSREYTASELKAASLFMLKIAKIFEPAGEECGVTYDDSTECAKLGGEAKQTSDLFMVLAKIPKGYDFAKTIGGEILVSKRIRDLFQEMELTGATFGPVRSAKGAKLVSDSWFQLIASTCTADIVPPTRIGINPFYDDDAGKYRCEKCGLLGLNLLSELWVNINPPRHDLIRTRQVIGARGGLVRTEPLLLVSPRFRQVLVNSKAKGCAFEIAHVT